MGKLKPIGSEKLEGIDKINRIMEIARYKENIPTPINEDKSVEYNITLSDGRNYQIHKEKSGYVIKRTISESTNDVDYIEPMKNRKYYSSYSQAFKRLNLIAKEVNLNENHNTNISLFNENKGIADEAKKYILKVKANEQEIPDEGQDSEAVPSTDSSVSMPEPTMTQEPTEPEAETTTDISAELDTELDTDDDEVVTFKTIQKLTGKLGQKIREFLSNEENKMSSKDIKYVVNSVLSALELNNLEPEDKEDIMSKFTGSETTPELPSTEISQDTEVQPETPPSPDSTETTGEMEEDLTIDDTKSMLKDIFDEETGSEEGEVKERMLQHHSMSDEESSKVEEMIEGMFTESKVNSILKKYFQIDERERKLLEDKKQKQVISDKDFLLVKKRIKNLSESVAQEKSSEKILSKYPHAKFLGKSTNNNLIFEVNNKKIRITTSGNIK